MTPTSDQPYRDLDEYVDDIAGPDPGRWHSAVRTAHEAVLAWRTLRAWHMATQWIRGQALIRYAVALDLDVDQVDDQQLRDWLQPYARDYEPVDGRDRADWEHAQELEIRVRDITTSAHDDLPTWPPLSPASAFATTWAAMTHPIPPNRLADDEGGDTLFEWACLFILEWARDTSPTSHRAA